MKEDSDPSIVCAFCGKRICRSEKTIGLLVMHYKKTNHQRFFNNLVQNTNLKIEIQKL